MRSDKEGKCFDIRPCCPSSALYESRGLSMAQSAHRAGISAIKR